MFLRINPHLYNPPLSFIRFTSSEWLFNFDRYWSLHPLVEISRWLSKHALDFSLVMVLENLARSLHIFRSPMDTHIEIALMHSRQQREKNEDVRNRSYRERRRRDALLLLRQYQSSPIPDPPHTATDFCKETESFVSVIRDQSSILATEGNRIEETHYDRIDSTPPYEDDDCPMEWSTPVLDEDEDTTFYDETDVAVAELPLITTPETRLHYFTNILTNEYCQSLLRTLRDAKICKSQCNAVIQLLKSALPEPNNMPSSLKQLLSAMNVENLFVKKKVCIPCEQEVPTEQIFCNQCRMVDPTKFASIYDIDLDRALSLLLRRLSKHIDEYKVKLDSTDPTEATSDIPFGMAYKELLMNRSVSQEIYFFSFYAQLWWPL